MLVFVLALLSLIHTKRVKEKQIGVYKFGYWWCQGPEREWNPIYAYRALKVIQYLMPAGITNKEWIRVGNQHDGGYVMIDDFSGVEVAYSLGVGGDWSWDMGLSSRGIKVYMFDPTIRPPSLNNIRLKYYALGIASHDTPGKKLMTLESLMRLDNNFNKTNMIFKMDVEGAEWDVLYNLAPSTLEKFSQILIEFHNLDVVLSSDENYKRVLAILEKLNRTHQLISFHPCNCARGNNLFGMIPVPITFEVSYVKRNGNFSFDVNKKRKRFDERCIELESEVFTWWLEGENIDFDGLLDYYGRISRTNMQIGNKNHLRTVASHKSVVRKKDTTKDVFKKQIMYVSGSSKKKR